MFNSKIFKISAAVLIVEFLFFGICPVFAQSGGEMPLPEQENVTKSGEAVYESIQSGATPEEIDVAAVNARETGGILYGIAGVAGNVLTFVSGLIDMAIEFGNTVSKTRTVRFGFDTVLGIANLGFVLAIIVIAFATIFRLESYAMKQTLQKLVIAALLVNFSLVIAGAFISFSNTFSNYFLGAFQNNSIGDALGNIIQPQKLSQVAGANDPEIFDAVKNISGFVSKFVVSLVFVVAFTLLIVLTFLALFVMLLIRGVALAFLLISMPLAWLASIFPYTAQYWKMWWTQFLRWTFFAPIVLFFIYIVVATGNSMGNPDSFFGSDSAGQTDQVSQTGTSFSAWNGSLFQGEGPVAPESQSSKVDWRQTAAAKGWEDGTVFPDGFFAYLSQLIIIIGLLIGGLFVANSLGITGAKAAYGAAKGMTTNLGKWAGKLPFRAGAFAARGVSLGQRITGAGNKLKGKPGADVLARWTGAGLSGLGGAIQKGQQYKSPGLFKSVLSGVKSGSGLFKKKEKAKDWECQSCGNIIRSSKKPVINCPNCGSPVATANWKEA